jgi:hypothetical protein
MSMGQPLACGGLVLVDPTGDGALSFPELSIAVTV